MLKAHRDEPLHLAYGFYFKQKLRLLWYGKL